MLDGAVTLTSCSYMIQAFIHGRKVRYQMALVDTANNGLLFRLKLMHDQEKLKKAAEANANAASPRMLPSPAASSSSSNSTPLGGHGTAASNNAPSTIPATPQVLAPQNDPNDHPGPHLITHVNYHYVWDQKSQSSGLRAALDRIDRSQATLNLPLLFKHFPRTFARVINTSLSPSDEHEPDIQDDECELYWPGQLITGEGLGWVCLLGMSMVKEFGRDYGYEGISGVVPRTSGDVDLGYVEPRWIKPEPPREAREHR